MFTIKTNYFFKLLVEELLSVKTHRALPTGAKQRAIGLFYTVFKQMIERWL